MSAANPRPLFKTLNHIVDLSYLDDFDYWSLVDEPSVGFIQGGAPINKSYERCFSTENGSITVLISMLLQTTSIYLTAKE